MDELHAHRKPILHDLAGVFTLEFEFLIKIKREKGRKGTKRRKKKERKKKEKR
jgi:hypothetical protein